MIAHMPEEASKRPGDVVIDFYMPNANAEDREAARKNLIGFIDLIVEIAMRRARETRSLPTRGLEENSVDFEGGASPLP